jgi:metal-responsive CopG/Arc/MetJ family transcriptional regulator
VKTAVSLPDPLFKRAETAAKKLGVSRSEFYARAIAEFLDRRQPEETTARLNELYSRIEANVDPVLDRLQMVSLPKEDW